MKVINIKLIHHQGNMVYLHQFFNIHHLFHRFYGKRQVQLVFRRGLMAQVDFMQFFKGLLGNGMLLFLYRILFYVLKTLGLCGALMGFVKRLRLF